ncbi:class I adenylate-forming enzyme family protein [Marinobacter sp. SS21]|uniref:class I adenylate-forming enzyme family protein n=1 Tax=Marinobacter sp. SS21 TaxID=2979460 RepID=UPI00232C4D42|nr:class I adenylate-forming enzyme family protein [Marinobacter sp. SS21]MDC0661165.1 class I adenylate-forming enzyme family protein [Marinobacter sp. SS21]
MKPLSETLINYAPALSGETLTPIGQQIQAYACSQPDKPALICGDASWSWAELVRQANRIANRLRGAGLEAGDTVAGLSENSADYVALYLGTLIAGGCMVPLSGMANGETLALMINDCDSRWLFVSRRNDSLLQEVQGQLARVPTEHCIGLDYRPATSECNLDDWLAGVGDHGEQTPVTLDSPFNLIYSSGTTGTPKGILHDYRFRSRQIRRMGSYGLNGDAINLVSTPLYSNTTLVSVLPTLFHGGTLVLMAKFDAREFLQLAQRFRVSHAMLVPVQFQRILAVPDFDEFDLSSFRLKLCTSAPLRGEVIEQVMQRWPGNLREVYGLTEGGISTSLDCAAHPDKWDSVGTPTEGSQVRILDEAGRELPRGEIGEIVGRAGAMMRGYYHRPTQTQDMLWTSPEGDTFFRSGDMGRLDEDGFLYILDRRKDMIISGGFNIYAADLEQVLLTHPAVADAAVIGVPSEQWGETPLGLVVRRADAQTRDSELLAWANERLGKTQRLAAVELRDDLPRSTIGKVLKKELRAPYWA